MYYYDTESKKVGKMVIIKCYPESMAQLVYLYLMQPRLIVYRMLIESLVFYDANTELKKFLEENISGLPVWIEKEYMKPETFQKDLFVANINRRSLKSDIYALNSRNTVQLYNLTTNVYYSVKVKAEVDTGGADIVVKTFYFNDVTLLPLGQATIEIPGTVKIKKIINVEGIAEGVGDKPQVEKGM